MTAPAPSALRADLIFLIFHIIFFPAIENYAGVVI